MCSYDLADLLAKYSERLLAARGLVAVAEASSPPVARPPGPASSQPGPPHATELGSPLQDSAMAASSPEQPLSAAWLAERGW